MPHRHVLRRETLILGMEALVLRREALWRIIWRVPLALALFKVGVVPGPHLPHHPSWFVEHDWHFVICFSHHFIIRFSFIRGHEHGDFRFSYEEFI